MKSILALLLSLYVTSAVAQSLGVGACVSRDMSTGWTSDENSCLRAGGTFHPPITGTYGYSITGNLPATSDTFITNSNTTPKCPDDYTVVFRTGGSPACARDIVEPK